MKTKHTHKWFIQDSVNRDGRRHLTIACSTCGKTKQQSRKLPSSKSRKAIPRQSEKRKEWDAKYREAKDACPEIVIEVFAGVPMLKKELEAHHPFGRVGERILAFVWLASWNHRLIHDVAATSRKLGWIQPQMSGRKPKGDEPRPWPVEAEANWPESLKRK